MSWVLHIFAIALWTGGLVVFARVRGDLAPAQRRSLLNMGLHPALGLVLFTGLLMIHERGMVVFSGGWMHIKLTLVALLIGLQVWLARGGERPLGWLTLPAGMLALVVIYLARVRPF
jgi:uncharacterized membrane protein